MVKYSEILIFKAIFLFQKSAESLQKKFSLENTKMRDKLLLIPYFDNFDFQCTLFSKSAPKFFFDRSENKILFSICKKLNNFC